MLISSNSIIPPPLQENELRDVNTIVVDDPTPNLIDGVFIEIEEAYDEEVDDEIEFSYHSSNSDNDELG